MTQDLSKLSKTSAKDNQIITNNLKRGDILFTPSCETPDDIGHSICIQENLPNTVYSYHLLRYRPNIIIDPLFSNYYFNNSKIRKQIIIYYFSINSTFCSKFITTNFLWRIIFFSIIF